MFVIFVFQNSDCYVFRCVFFVFICLSLLGVLDLWGDIFYQFWKVLCYYLFKYFYPFCLFSSWTPIIHKLNRLLFSFRSLFILITALLFPIYVLKSLNFYSAKVFFGICLLNTPFLMSYFSHFYHFYLLSK